MKLLSVFIIACFVLYSEAKPTDEGNQIGGHDHKQHSVTNIPECHGVACPAGTTSCQMTEIGEKTIHCINSEGNILYSAPCPLESGHGHGNHGHGHGHGHH